MSMMFIEDKLFVKAWVRTFGDDGIGYERYVSLEDFKCKNCRHYEYEEDEREGCFHECDYFKCGLNDGGNGFCSWWMPKEDEGCDRRHREERTCHIDGGYYDEIMESHYTQLSCGHEVRGYEEDISYCIYCGAKVVSE